VFVFRIKSTEKVKRYGRQIKKFSLFANVNLSAFASKGVRQATLV
jgi:hypothetical protein